MVLNSFGFLGILNMVIGDKDVLVLFETVFGTVGAVQVSGQRGRPVWLEVAAWLMTGNQSTNGLSFE